MAKLEVIHGNLWAEHDAGRKVVVTTNIGWSRDGYNNMGAGMALQAARRWPVLPLWYGTVCQLLREATPVVEHAELGLIFFPVKPLLDPSNPERSWDQIADHALIMRSLRQLALVEGDVSMGFPGCGNGSLLPSTVLPLLERYLPGERFRVVDAEVPPAIMRTRCPTRKKTSPRA